MTDFNLKCSTLLIIMKFYLQLGSVKIDKLAIGDDFFIDVVMTSLFIRHYVKNVGVAWKL